MNEMNSQGGFYSLILPPNYKQPNMQKQEIIVIGDVHGEQEWKEIIKSHPNGKFIFLGDYCDPHNEKLSYNDVIENLKEIIQFKKEHSDCVTLLLGNHDIQYIYDESCKCSRYMQYVSYEIGTIFKENISLFEKVYHFKRILFTHAGVTEEWFKTTFPERNRKCIVEAINDCYDNKRLFACGIARWGRELYGGIYWADKREFEHPLNGWIQIVGHNRVQDILLKQTNEKTAIIFCDCLLHKKYLTIIQEENSLHFYIAQIGRNEKSLLYTSHSLNDV